MRWLPCTRCHEIVGVHEHPFEFIDPERYVCGNCLQPVDGQLELEGERTEERRYDPDIAAFPKGF